MTNLSTQAQALKDAVKTLYQDEKCAEMGWETDKPTITVVLRELVNQLKYIGITEKNILEIADELEVL
jgi:DNA-binding transcriptional regulator YhcF (GntR family)